MPTYSICTTFHCHRTDTRINRNTPSPRNARIALSAVGQSSESESDFLYSVLLRNNHLPIRYRHRQSRSTAYRLQARLAPTGPGLRLTAMPALICCLMVSTRPSQPFINSGSIKGVETIIWQNRATYGCSPKCVSADFGCGLGCTCTLDICVVQRRCRCSMRLAVLYKCLCLRSVIVQCWQKRYLQ